MTVIAAPLLPLHNGEPRWYARIGTWCIGKVDPPKSHQPDPRFAEMRTFLKKTSR